MKGQSLLIGALLFAFIIAVFAVINVDSVQVNFMFTQAQLPLILVILASTLLGGLTVGFIGGLRQFKLQRAVRTLEKRVAELSAETEQFVVSSSLDNKEQKDTPSSQPAQS